MMKGFRRSKAAKTHEVFWGTLEGAAHETAPIPGCITSPDQGGMASASGVATAKASAAIAHEKTRRLKEEHATGCGVGAGVFGYNFITGTNVSPFPARSGWTVYKKMKLFVTCQLCEIWGDFLTGCGEGTHHAVGGFSYRPDLVFAGDDVFSIGIEVAHDLVVPGGFAESLEDFCISPRAVIGDGHRDELAFDESGKLRIG